MRHIYTNRVVVLITAMLLAAAALVAWFRSRPPPPLPTPPPAPHGGAAADDRLLDLGAQVYARACLGCHAPDEPDRHVPRRLARQTADLLTHEGGRAYLANLLLYGASGQPAPGGRSLRHPPFATLTDREAAGVLNLILADADPNADADAQPASAPFTPADIAHARATPLAREDVPASRPRTHAPAR